MQLKEVICYFTDNINNSCGTRNRNILYNIVSAKGYNLYKGN